MSEEQIPSVAIVDYGMGNLFSVKQACQHVGLKATLTTTPEELAAADGVILPGVGAFGDAIESLHRLDLVEPLQDIGASDKPLIGICLGMQLLMSESYEFGSHAGLGIINGPVVPFEGEDGRSDDSGYGNGETLKVPQVGWNRIFSPPEHQGNSNSEEPRENPWGGSCLAGLQDGEYMYFVHSFYVKPEDPGVVLAASRYGAVEFCSSLRYRNIFGCQFHPERSGPQGLKIYRNLARIFNQAAKYPEK